jgi:hypothetical protein
MKAGEIADSFHLKLDSVCHLSRSTQFDLSVSTLVFKRSYELQAKQCGQ